jgi:hypothetical protein
MSRREAGMKERKEVDDGLARIKDGKKNKRETMSSFKCVLHVTPGHVVIVYTKQHNTHCTQHITTQHNTTQHNTTQHNTTA